MSTSLEKHGRKTRSRQADRDQPKPIRQAAPQDKSDDERVLKDFDLDYAFGPSYGISRLERWERAESLGLNPPPSVRDLLIQHSSEPSYEESWWTRKL